MSKELVAVITVSRTADGKHAIKVDVNGDHKAMDLMDAVHLPISDWMDNQSLGTGI